MAKSKMHDSLKVSNLLSIGLSSALAHKVVASGYTLSTLKSAAKHQLLKFFSAEEVELICAAVKRQPIPRETVQKLVEDSDWKCCICWDIKSESPVILHHIEEHSKTHDDSYDNLVVLCLNHHAMAHSRWDISRSPCPPELIHHRKGQWVKAVTDFKAGRRPAPGHEPPSAAVLNVTAPSPPSSFTGRSLCRSTIRDALVAGKHIALQGMGGIGKTATAQQVAAELVERFPGGIFWGSLADYNGNPVSILRNWFYLCEGELPPQGDSESLAQHVRSLLASRKDCVGSLLVVIDDARQDWLNATRLIKSVIPHGSPLLLTTRSETLAALLDVKLQSLNVMSEDEAFDLLKAHVSSEIEDVEVDAAHAILKAIGYLPLAIELVGKRLMLLSQKPGLHLDTLCQGIEKQADAALALPGHQGLAATFSATYEELTGEDSQLFRWLGVFANGPIHLQDLSGVLGRDTGAVELSMDYLVSCALLGWGTSVGLYTLHPLLRQYAQTLLHRDPKEFEHANQNHLSYYLNLAQHHACENSAAHDRLEVALPNLLAATDFATLRQDVEALNELCRALWVDSSFLPTRCYMTDAVNLLSKAVFACHECGDRKSEGMHLNHLGVAHAHMGEISQAFACLKRALTLNREIGNPYDECAILANLSWLYRDTGQYREALSYSEQALDLATKTENPRVVLDTLGNLGSIYRTLGNSSMAMTYGDHLLPSG